MFYSLVAVAGIIYAIIQTRRNLARLRALKLGRDGEKAVGQYLEQVRDVDARVFHDLIGEGFNLDHVLVTTKGIFAIETKTCSKPVRGEANITYDGEHLFVNGQRPVQTTASTITPSKEAAERFELQQNETRALG